MTAPVVESRLDIYRAEYAHQRFCGIARTNALHHLARAYNVRPAYLAELLKEQS